MYEYEYKTLEELSHRAAQHDIRIADVVIRHEMETSEQTEKVVRQRMVSRHRGRSYRYGNFCKRTRRGRCK